MKKSMGESLLYMLDAFGGLGYSAAFLLLLLWIRLLLMVIENALRPDHGRTHRFVHPLPNSVSRSKMKRGTDAAESKARGKIEARSHEEIRMPA